MPWSPPAPPPGRSELAKNRPSSPSEPAKNRPSSPARGSDQPDRIAARPGPANPLLFGSRTEAGSGGSPPHGRRKETAGLTRTHGPHPLRAGGVFSPMTARVPLPPSPSFLSAQSPFATAAAAGLPRRAPCVVGVGVCLVVRRSGGGSTGKGGWVKLKTTPTRGHFPARGRGGAGAGRCCGGTDEVGTTGGAAALAQLLD